MRPWALVPILVPVAALGGVLALSPGPGRAEGRPAGRGSTTVTDRGIRWRFDGRAVVVTVTGEASSTVRRRLRGDVVVGCSRVPVLGSDAQAKTGVGTVRLARIPGTVRVRLMPRITRADACFVEREGGSEDVAGVRFPADAYASTRGGSTPSDADRAAIVATLVQHFDAVIARDRRRECATYTENAAAAVAAYQRRFLLRPTTARDCVGVYRALERETPRDSSGVVFLDDEAARKALRAPETLDLKVKHGRARIARTGTPLDHGFELVRVDGRWLIDHLPA